MNEATGGRHERLYGQANRPEGTFLDHVEVALTKIVHQPSFLCCHQPTSTGIIEMAMIPTITTDKFFCTHGRLPKK